jgi:hypothetical protein
VTPTILTEQDLQNAVKSAAKHLGYLCYHTHYSIGSEAGFPDLHVIGHGRQFVFEFKGPKGRISPDQRRWIETYQAIGVDARFVFPGDYETVLAELMQAYEEKP